MYPVERWFRFGAEGCHKKHTALVGYFGDVHCKYFGCVLRDDFD